VCGADWSGENQCRRCRADLNLLAAVLNASTAYLNSARSRFQSGEFDEALMHAVESLKLLRTRPALQLKAASLLMLRRFNEAMETYSDLVNS
jgi:hypothetical protein